MLYKYCTVLIVTEQYVYDSYLVLPQASRPRAAPATRIHSVRVADLAVVPSTQPAQLAHLRASGYYWHWQHRGAGQDSSGWPDAGGSLRPAAAGAWPRQACRGRSGRRSILDCQSPNLNERLYCRAIARQGPAGSRCPGRGCARAARAVTVTVQS
jgi:hypothetical protein